MPTYIDIESALDASTRAKRRRIVSYLISELSMICQAEASCMNHIPANLRGVGAHSAAEKSIDLLTDAIVSLMEAY